MEIPTEKDWENWKDGLDIEYAYKQFAGKSINEAIELFSENAIYYQEDLIWMPEVPFQFYIQAYKEYILSDRSKYDPDGASCYLRLLKQKLENEPTHILPIFNTLLPSMKIVAERQDFYDADTEIYGDFKKLLSSITKLYEKLKLKND